MIVDAFAKNDQLYGATYLINSYGRLCKFLNETTNRSFRIDGTRIVEEKEESDIPF